MTKISVLGLGAMGSRLAANYRQAGHDVTVWNRNGDVADRHAAQHGTTVADSPRSAATGAEVIVAMVSNDEAATSVWLDDKHGALHAAAPGTIIVESSTLTPGTVRELGAEAAARGVKFVEAPVVGSRPQAEAGALFYVLGGQEQHIDDVQAIIDINAVSSSRVGPVGNAATLKLAINGLFAAQVAAYAEIAGFLERSDLDTADAFATLAALPITSPGLERILGLIENRNYAPNFPIHLVAKDLGYLLNSAEAHAAPVPIMSSAARLFDDEASGANRDLDIAGIARRYHSECGGRAAGMGS